MEISIAAAILVVLALGIAICRGVHTPRKAHGFVSALGRRGRISASEVAGFTPGGRASAASAGKPVGS